jgi:hypothetical protein
MMLLIGVTMYDQAIDTEVARVNNHSRKLLNEYLKWDQKIKTGQAENTLYSDLIDFVNFRFETVDTCLMLIEKEKIADALGLCRSILENYMLLMLMCRGHKYFRLQNLENKTTAEFNAYLLSQQQELEKRQKAGNESCLAVKKYPRAKRHLMYIFEGLKDQSETDFKIPIHFFEFQEFYPETMRLRDEDYFVYHLPSPSVTEAQKKHRQDTVFKYRHYLSYDALMQCLELNDIADKAAQTRIEAHYTFLGKYLHPTHNAARNLHQRNNWHSRQTILGFDQPYEKTAILLASLYVCFLLTGILEEVAGLLENAPPRYISDAGTTELRSLTNQTHQSFNYFWFIFNEAPLYDKLIYCIHHVSNKELATLKHYHNIPSKKVPFNMSIYSHLKDALSGWSNERCGDYISPLIRG